MNPHIRQESVQDALAGVRDTCRGRGRQSARHGISSDSLDLSHIRKLNGLQLLDERTVKLHEPPLSAPDESL